MDSLNGCPYFFLLVKLNCKQGFIELEMAQWKNTGEVF